MAPQDAAKLIAEQSKQRMLMKRTSILCLQCATVFPKSRAKIATCPECGWRMAKSEFEGLYSDARRVLNLGYRYRETYESQVDRTGRVSSMASLHDPAQWLVFAEIAAISGIIGNVSYDIVRTVIKKLYAHASTKAKKEHPEFASDSGIEVFVRYSRDFLNGMPEVNVTVRHAIEQEERAEITSALTARALKGVDKDDSEAVRKAISESLRAAARKIKAGKTSVMNRRQMQQLLSEVWNELPE